MRHVILALLALLLPILAPQPRAQAAPAPAPAAASPPALTPEQAQSVLEILNDPAKRAQFAATLEAMTHALPASRPAPTAAGAGQVAPAEAAAPPAPAALSSTPNPAPAPAAAAKAPMKPAGVSVAPNSLGAAVVRRLSGGLAASSARLVQAVRMLTDFNGIGMWLKRTTTDPTARAETLDAAGKTALVMVVALCAEYLVRRLLFRTRESLGNAMLNGKNGEATTAPAAFEQGSTGEPEPTEPDEPDEPANGANLPDLVEPEAPAEQPRLPMALPLAAPLRRRRLSSAWRRLRRLPLLLARLVLDLVPVGVFLAVGDLLAGTPLGEPATTRVAVLDLVQAYAILQVIMAVTHMLVDAPEAEAGDAASQRLRLLAVSDRGAAFIILWVRRVVAVVLFGTAFVDIAGALGMWLAGRVALLKLVALVAHLLMVVVVIKVRRPVAAWLRAGKEAVGPIATLRNHVADIWHWIAIFLILAFWVLYAFEVQDGLSSLARFAVSTAAVLVVARLAGLVMVGGLERGFRVSPDLAARYPGLQLRIGRYHPVLRRILSAILAVATFLLLLQVWGMDVLVWFSDGSLGGRTLSALGTIGVTALLALLVWEACDVAANRQIERMTREGALARAARLRTLLPMLRTALFVTICLIVGLTALSEIGVNIAPLLAGAGVVGVAIGFGSQKLVQDLITGLFLLLENAIQVGDVVTVSGLSGTVEHLSIRTIRLRALDGSIHIIPFSAVTTVTNSTRDFGYAVLDVTLSVNEEPDPVAEVLCAIATELRGEERWRPVILADLELFGVDKLIQDAWILRARLKTTPTQRWAVAREFNRRLKYRFDALAIESPFTSNRVLSTVPGPEPTAPAAAPES
jgi:moderate conductance mechanosensitive channel